MALHTDGLWSEGIYLKMGKLPEFRVVNSTQKAFDILVNQWPVEGGDAHRSAVAICLNVLAGELPPDEARQAFILAAEEAGLYVAEKMPRYLALVTPTDPNRESTYIKLYPRKRRR